MRILLVNTFFWPNEVGGAEHSVKVLAEGLSELGNEVVVLCVGKKASEQFVGTVRVFYRRALNIYQPTGATQRRSPLAKALWHAIDGFNPFEFVRSAFLISKLKPDLIHTNNLSGFSPAIWLAAKLLGVPVVHTPRDFYLLCKSSTMTAAGLNCATPCTSCRRATALKRKFAGLPSKHLAISEYMRKVHVVNGVFQGTNWAVIPNAVAMEPGNRQPLTRVAEPQVRAKFTVGYLGRLEKAKGIEVYFQSLEKASCRYEILSVLGGSGDDEYIAGLKRLADDLSISHQFLGRVKPSEFFAKVDLLVVPSQWNEPLGRVAIEALSYGVPVVVTPVGGLPEVAVGVAALVADGCDPISLADAINLMLERIHSDPIRIAESCSAEGVKYQPSAIAQRYLAEYRKLLGPD